MRDGRRSLVGALLSAAALMMAGGPPAAAQSGDAVAVVRAFHAAYESRDLEGALGHFAETAEIPDCACPTIEQKRPAFRAAFQADHRRVLHNLRATGDSATVLWEWESQREPNRRLGAPPLTGTGRATVVDGRITSIETLTDSGSEQRVQAALQAQATQTAIAFSAALSTRVAAQSGTQEKGLGAASTQSRTTPSPAGWVIAASLSVLTGLFAAARRRTDRLPRSTGID